jgi:putative two-component system response regulator
VSEREAVGENGNAGSEPLAWSLLESYARDLTRLRRDKEQLESFWAANEGNLAKLATDLERALRAAEDRARELEAQAYDNALRLLRVSEARDFETGGHLERISRYVALLGERLGWQEIRIRETAAAAALHDLGKIAIPDSILLKQGPLDAAEWAVLQRHATIGAELLSGSASPILQIAEKIARSHHERWDGSGYPDGLVGEQIPLEARLVMLADVYDALRSRRPYKRPLAHDEVARVIRFGDRRTLREHFDPAMLTLFEALAPDFDRVFLSTSGEAVLGKELPGLLTRRARVVQLDLLADFA